MEGEGMYPLDILQRVNSIFLDVNHDYEVEYLELVIMVSIVVQSFAGLLLHFHQLCLVHLLWALAMVMNGYIFHVMSLWLELSKGTYPILITLFCFIGEVLLVTCITYFNLWHYISRYYFLFLSKLRRNPPFLDCMAEIEWPSWNDYGLARSTSKSQFIHCQKDFALRNSCGQLS